MVNTSTSFAEQESFKNGILMHDAYGGRGEKGKGMVPCRKSQLLVHSPLLKLLRICLSCRLVRLLS